MTIHTGHPFAAPEPERDPARRLRGRLGGVVTLWTAGSGAGRAGLTVSSVLLAWRHRDLADAFAGVAPAPGGPFRLGRWTDTPWGPVLDGVSAWVGIRCEGPGTPVGWSRLVDGALEHAELLPEDVEAGEADAPLVHRRGRYVRPSGRG